MSLVVVDADVLGRQRTGDETYVRNLLRTLPAPAAEAGLRIAAVTRRPDLVPDGVEPLELGTTLAGAPHGVDAAALRSAGSARRSCTRSTRAAPLPVPGGRDDPRPLVRGRRR